MTPLTEARVRELREMVFVGVSITKDDQQWRKAISELCTAWLANSTRPSGVVADERLDQRMSREKLESAIAWFSGEEKPSNRRVTRGDLRSMLLELQRLRALTHPAQPEPTKCEACDGIGQIGTYDEGCRVCGGTGAAPAAPASAPSARGE